MRSDKCFVSSFASSHFFRISVLLFFGAESDFWRKISVRRCLIPYDNVPNAIDMTWSALSGAVDNSTLLHSFVIFPMRKTIFGVRGCFPASHGQEKKDLIASE